MRLPTLVMTLAFGLPSCAAEAGSVQPAEPVYEPPFGPSATSRIGGGRSTARIARRDPQLARAVGDGLAWLRDHQDPAGGWGQDSAFVLLALLSHGSTTRSGPFAEQVRTAVSIVGRPRDQGEEPAGAIAEAAAAWSLAEAAVVSLDDAVTALAKERLRRFVSWYRADGALLVPGAPRPADLLAARLGHMALLAGRELGCVGKVVEKAAARWIQVQAPEDLGPSVAAAAWLWNNLSGEALRAFDHSRDAGRWTSVDASGVHLFAVARAMYYVGGQRWFDFHGATLRELLRDQRPDGAWSGRGPGLSTRTRTVMALLALESSWLYMRIGR